MSEYYVYLHRKATSGEVFYVGKGLGPRAEQKTNRNRHWHNVVKRHGLVVERLEPLLCESDAFALERYLIAGYRALGVRLVNLTVGGEGAAGRVVSTLSRAKASVTHMSLNADPEKYAKRVAALQAPEVRAKMSASRKGKTVSPETRARMAEASRARWADPESRAKMVAALTGVKKSAEACAKMGPARRGREVSPETRAKISAFWATRKGS